MTGPEAIAAAERLLKGLKPCAQFQGDPLHGSCCGEPYTAHLIRDMCSALLQSQEALRQRQELIEAIYVTARTDEKSECWTIRKYLDARDIFNDDIAGSERLIEVACAALLSPPVAPKER